MEAGGFDGALQHLGADVGRKTAQQGAVCRGNRIYGPTGSGDGVRGIAYKKSDWEGWGYSGADNDEDFLAKLADVIEPLLQSPHVQGFCYTQLTDVEQEINGLLTYDRALKVPLEKIRQIVAGKV